MAYHEPVMAGESMQALAIQPDGVYVDATFGGGGHARKILKALGDKGRLIGFDQDEDARQNAIEDPRFTFVHHNFRFLRRFLRLHGATAVDGILADLGVSSHQLDQPERGFSYRYDSALDMRMSRDTALTAAEIVNTYPPADLQRILGEYGEVRNARTLAARIVEERQFRLFQSVGDLLGVITPVIKGQRHRYLSQVFQALRIEVNDEMGALADFLQQTLEVLRPGGRLVVIAYHSIEDRMVKNFLKTGDIEGKVEKDFYGNIYRPFRLAVKKPILPADDEIRRNPRARSAKLRVGIRAGEQ